ncbi:phage portal protein [Telmatobacter bradus]|uniref:phage portal protein n=1 Tax=Telmatobacter bradus TaxID=474953 RepID=UPI003B42AC02
MGVLTRRLGISNLSLEDPAQPLLPYSELFESLGLGRSDAGVMVNEKQAMRITTAYACIMIISSDLASLPLSVMQRLPDGTVREATEHPLYGILQSTPNSVMTSITFRSAWLASALGWGNGYAFVRRDGASRTRELLPLPSERTSPVLRAVDEKSGKRKLLYATTATNTGEVQYIDPDDVLHLPGMSFDGYVGMSPIQTCKNAFGIAIAAEKFGAQLFGNGAKASGVLSHPGQLGTEALENLKKSIREAVTAENALRPLVLEEGMKWEQLTINPNDAQFLETRKFQREEIASLYRVPMHLLQSLERATNNNIEHQSLDYIRYCLRPWAVRIEQEINRKLLSGSYFVEHDFNAFQRGDYASQVQGMMALRLGGVYNANDCLRQLRQNTIPVEEGGEVRLAPLNTIPLKQLASEAAMDSAAQKDNETSTDTDQGEPITDLRRTRVTAAYRRLFRDAVGRIVNRKNRDEAAAYRALQPVIASMAESVMAMYFTPDKEMKEIAENQSANLARQQAAKCAEWSIDQAAILATTLTDQVYTALYRALIEGRP